MPRKKKEQLRTFYWSLIAGGIMIAGLALVLVIAPLTPSTTTAYVPTAEYLLRNPAAQPIFLDFDTDCPAASLCADLLYTPLLGPNFTSEAIDDLLASVVIYLDGQALSNEYWSIQISETDVNRAHIQLMTANLPDGLHLVEITALDATGDSQSYQLALRLGQPTPGLPATQAVPPTSAVATAIP